MLVRRAWGGNELRLHCDLLYFMKVTSTFYHELSGQWPEDMMFRHIQLPGHYYNRNSKMKTGKVSFSSSAAV